MSASKVHSYTSTDWVGAPVRERRSERGKETCSGIVLYVTHNASVIAVSVVFIVFFFSFVVSFCSGKGKVSVHCFSCMWTLQAKCPLTPRPRGNPPDSGLVSQWVKKRGHNRIQIKMIFLKKKCIRVEGRSRAESSASPLHVYLSLSSSFLKNKNSLMWLDWIKVNLKHS